MRQPAFLIILPFCFFASGYSQAKFKVLTAITKQPIKDQYCSIIKDSGTWVDIGNTNNQGIFKPEVRPDSSSTYQLWIFAEGFKPLKRDVNLFSNGLVTVFINPDKESLRKNPNYVYSTCSSIGFGDYRGLHTIGFAD
jgi:hypothetical protein